MKYRSLLFVPAKEKMLGKISGFSADGYIIDLEDSVAEEDKDNALVRVQDYLAEKKSDNIWVRINRNRQNEELKNLKKFDVGFMLPKFEDCSQYEDSADILSQHKVIALIETPISMVNIGQIARCDYVDALALGAEDYSAGMNMVNNSQNLLYVRSLLLNYAKAYNKAVYDTPSFQINDFELFKEEVNTACDMGFDGKLAINPKHISYINESFGKCDFDFMRSVISQYEDSGEAVVVIDGVVYEKMHINRMKKIIKENGGM